MQPLLPSYSPCCHHAALAAIMHPSKPRRLVYSPVTGLYSSVTGLYSLSPATDLYTLVNSPCHHKAAAAAIMQPLLPPSCSSCFHHIPPAAIMQPLLQSCTPRCNHAPLKAIMWTLLLHLPLLLLLQSPRHCLKTGDGPCSGSECVSSSTRNCPVYWRYPPILYYINLLTVNHPWVMFCLLPNNSLPPHW